jgi:hypothetical protein
VSFQTWGTSLYIRDIRKLGLQPCRISQDWVLPAASENAGFIDRLGTFAYEHVLRGSEIQIFSRYSLHSRFISWLFQKGYRKCATRLSFPVLTGTRTYIYHSGDGVVSNTVGNQVWFYLDWFLYVFCTGTVQ